jgi:hypothetical protein
MTDRTSPDGASPFPRPSVFGDESFTDAVVRASAERRWLLVDVVDVKNPASWAAGYFERLGVRATPEPWRTRPCRSRTTRRCGRRFADVRSR